MQPFVRRVFDEEEYEELSNPASSVFVVAEQGAGEEPQPEGEPASHALATALAPEFDSRGAPTSCPYCGVRPTLARPEKCLNCGEERTYASAIHCVRDDEECPFCHRLRTPFGVGALTPEGWPVPILDGCTCGPEALGWPRAAAEQTLAPGHRPTV